MRNGISLKTTDNTKKLVIGYNIQSFVCLMLVWNPIISCMSKQSMGRPNIFQFFYAFKHVTVSEFN